MLYNLIVHLDSLNSFLRSRDDRLLRRIKHTTTMMASVIITMAIKEMTTHTITKTSLPVGATVGDGDTILLPVGAGGVPVVDGDSALLPVDARGITGTGTDSAIIRNTTLLFHMQIARYLLVYNNPLVCHTKQKATSVKSHLLSPLIDTSSSLFIHSTCIRL